MVTVNIEVNGQIRKLYQDNKLNNSINNKIKPKVQIKDFDWVWIVDGPEGSGKSVLAQQLAITLDPTFCVERMCMTPDDFTKAVVRAKKNQCIVFDEAFTGLSSRGSLTEINKLIVSLMMEMRQKNLFVIIVMPTFFLLDRYVALFRARGLFHVYLKNGKRGRWIYFNNKKKKILYLKGKKLFDYSFPKSNFRGRFYDQYTIEEEAYRLKKKEALNNKSRSTRAETYKAQRDSLVYILSKEYTLSDSKIESIMKKYGSNLKRRTICDIKLEIDKQMARSEIEDSELEELEENTPEIEDIEDMLE